MEITITIEPYITGPPGVLQVTVENGTGSLKSTSRQADIESALKWATEEALWFCALLRNR